MGKGKVIKLPKEILYFSYGSNMSSKRLLARTPSAKFYAVAMLPEHVLEWHKIGADHSGKCDIDFTGDPADHVIGVVFKIRRQDKKSLDAAEGLGNGYEHKLVELYKENGKTIKAFTYFATNIGYQLKPYDWYKKHVLTGAIEFNLPPAYVNMIKRVKAKPGRAQRRRHPKWDSNWGFNDYDGPMSGSIYRDHR